MTIDINLNGYNDQHELGQSGFLGKSSLAARERAKSLGKGEQSLKIAGISPDSAGLEEDMARPRTPPAR
jgi:hypothetical protein